MKRALRWLRNGFLGLTALVVVTGLVVYVVSERMTRRTYDTAGQPVVVPRDSASTREGGRLAHIRGCTGCHGEHLEGYVMIDNPLLAHVVAPNLTLAAGKYTDAELERIIRHGIRPDDKSVFVMPSSMFTLLDDADLGRIIAYVRSVPRLSGHPRDQRLGPGARVMFALQKFQPSAVNVGLARALSPSYPGERDVTARGAYLARTSCTECHGIDLRGVDKAPDLRIAAGYSREAFVRFMRTGKALGDRELPTMSDIARGRFSLFTDTELAALHDFLLARAALPMAGRPKTE